MLGLIIAITLFNLIAFKTNKTLTKGQIAHIFVFTTAFQLNFDLYIDLKYHGYWYFTKGIDWFSLPAHSLLLPPVNMMFLNWYPFQSTLWKKAFYFICWEAVLLSYEYLTLLPEPYGYFHYGWWDIWHSVVVNPVLLLILVWYFKRYIAIPEKE